MPTAFDTPDPGDLIEIANLSQLFAPINNLEKGASYWAGTTTGSANAYTVTLSPAPTAYTAGMIVTAKIHAANTDASTINVNGLGVKEIRLLNAALAADQLALNSTYTLIYDGTYFQLIGGGGGGSATTDAGDLTTGTLAAARLPGVLANVDTQAELLSAAAAAAASHTHAASDIASGSLATARLADGTATAGYVPISDGDGTSTWGAPSATDSTKLPLAGGAMTGAVSFSGSISSAGSSTRNIHGNGNANDFYVNTPTGGVFGVSVNGTHKGSISGNGFVPGAGSTPGNENIINLASYLNFSCNSGYFGHAFYQGSSSIQALICKAGLQFPTAHDAPTDTVYGIFRRSTPNATVVQSGDVIIDKGRLLSRTASAAIEICPVASGDEAWVRILETTIAGCIAHVNSAGTVTLYSPTGGTVSASIVNSSSPAAGEYGVYLSAGVLYFKGGSSYAGKMAAFCTLGKS